jgi:hypothetical protein
VATDFDWFERGPAVAPGAYTPLPLHRLPGSCHASGLDAMATAQDDGDDDGDDERDEEAGDEPENENEGGEAVSFSALAAARLLAHHSAHDAGLLEGFTSGGFSGTAALLAEAV